MNAGPKSTDSKEPEPRTGGQGIIFAVVGAASGVFMATRLTSVLPVWAAVMLTFVLWLLLVVCMAASCGSELVDIVVGSVTIIVVMTVLVPAFVRKRQRDHQVKPPAAQSYIRPVGAEKQKGVGGGSARFYTQVIPSGIPGNHGEKLGLRVERVK